MTKPTDSPGADLEYDLAHEAAAATEDDSARHEPPVVVATDTPDYAGDYSYDLAHDLPRA